VVTALLAVALAAPPRATLSTPVATAPLAVSGWCWGGHCGAPIAASTRTVAVARGGLVRVVFAFTPTRVAVAVAGRPPAVARSGREISWHARGGGGLTVDATGTRGFVTYVGRLKVS
jgi:dienelactone hydrolase